MMDKGRGGTGEDPHPAASEGALSLSIPRPKPPL